MTKILAMLLLGIVAAPLSAHEIAKQDRNRVDALSQMARIHAQKACYGSTERQRSACEAGEIRALAETAASVSALRPSGMSASTFAAVIANQAGGALRYDWQASLTGNEAPVDCRINVC